MSLIACSFSNMFLSKYISFEFHPLWVDRDHGQYSQNISLKFVHTMTYRSFLDFVVSLQFNIQNKELFQWHSVSVIGRHKSFLVTSYTTECDSICTKLNHIWLSLQYQNLLAYFTVKEEWRAVWSGRLIDIFARQIWSIWTRCIYLQIIHTHYKLEWTNLYIKLEGSKKET